MELRIDDEIRIGDRVMVVNEGRTHDYHLPPIGTRGTVVGINEGSGVMWFLLELDDGKQVYVGDYAVGKLA